MARLLSSLIIQDIISDYKSPKMCYTFFMSKNFLNRKQKKILYKNIGFLFALTVLCAVFARRITDGRGETLQDLAERQEREAAASDSPSAESPEPPTQDSSLPAEDQPGTEGESPKGTPAPSDSLSAEKQDNAEEEAKPVPSEEETPAMADRVTYQDGFYYESLNDTIKDRITGVSYPADDSNAAISYDTLRYVKVLYYDFEDEIQSGELICHKAIAQDLVEIFYELYKAQYPIEKIALVDDYQGDDSVSMRNNNTSCFNYRFQSSKKLSNHAYGLAVDLNPLYNPQVRHQSDGSVNITPAEGESYADRESSFPHKIDKEDLAYRLFIQHGFSWGGNWRSSKDYQHFEKEI